MILMLLVCGSCIDPFQPVINDTQEVLVINGVITEKPGIHQVKVSVSTPYNNPSSVPISGCVVRVEDELGNMAVYEEGEPGTYEVYLDSSFLALNKLYSLSVVTLNGDEYRSTYDTLLACPPIDTLYYEVQSLGTSNADVTYYGLQFYADLSGSDDASRNFRWLLQETWEYRSVVKANVVWDGVTVIPIYVDSIYTCYMTDQVKDLHSASTKYLIENSLKYNKLNFVSNATPRIRLQYSLLVTQQSLTDEIYGYWERMRSQLSDGGGLYETQPSSTIGNIYNINSPEEKVLGCFYATQQQSKRLTVNRLEIKSEFDFNVPGFTCNSDTTADLSDIGFKYPYFLKSLDPMMAIGPPYVYGARACFDCRLSGGTNLKPGYW